MEKNEAKERMIRFDLEGRGIRDPRVIEAFRKVPRESFVRAGDEAAAYGDFPLPIGCGQTISQPYIVALMTEACRLGGSETVLDVGTGSGYQAAILAELVEKVVTIERIPELHERARKRLEGYENVTCLLGDGGLGWEAESPYDAIVVAAQTPKIPPALLRQLKIGGRLIIPVGDRFSQELLRVTRSDENSWDREFLCGVRFVPLISEAG
ncbi:MAG: protein-L-isoaspartate(D-aspartate) O-methyltransferase [Candidatus Hydrogenedentota bacterium]|nr:MAG: protein-L-isoaspartate(D-aspartate) O-methyltransferase [Candidatus Hydrogenedentota bacterium]